VALEIGRRQAEERSLPIDWREADLESLELAAAEYDLVVNFNYLQRSLIPAIKAALKGGGFVIFETYSIDQRSIGHPTNPAYLLRPNELLEHFHDFRILCYREGRFWNGGEPCYRAGIFARKGG
jgi:hypothetical protein